MKMLLKAAMTFIELPGATRPDNCSIYAIVYREDGTFEGRWLPDAYEVEDCCDELATLHPPVQKNPLKITLPGKPIIDHPDHGEFFKLADGAIAQVFNRDRKTTRSK
jgi:hypothetical protein